MNKKIIFLLLLILISISFCFAQDTNDSNTEIVFNFSQNYLNYQEKSKELRLTIIELREDGFSINRLADELFVLNQLLENNMNLELQNRVANYQKVDEKVRQIELIIINARLAKDEIDTFKLAIQNVEDEVDTQELWGLSNQANAEFNDERYEQCISLIETGYTKIIELQSIEAKASAMADAASKNLANFLRENWFFIILIILIPIILFLLFRKKIKLFFLNKKLEENNSEIIILKEELKKSQTRYFIDGKLSENEFQIKTTIYSEKIRELNRQNALLNEAIASLISKKNLKKLNLESEKEKLKEQAILENKKNEEIKRSQEKISFDEVKKLSNKKVIKNKKIINKKVIKKKKN